MKLFILFAIFSTSVFSQTQFLSNKEAKQMVYSLDKVCADTYCAGDLNFRPQKITCMKDSCIVNYIVEGVSYFNLERSLAAENKPVHSREINDAIINIFNLNIESTEDNTDDFQYLYAEFNCTLNNLTANLNQYSDKDDMFYSMVVFGCVDELEKIVFARNL
jgi:hypothetical protein